MTREKFDKVSRQDELIESEWVYDNIGGERRKVCLNCRDWGYTKWDIATPYCPVCGAKMKNGYKHFDDDNPSEPPHIRKITKEEKGVGE